VGGRRGAQERPRVPEEYAMNSHYRWVIVADGAFMGCVAIDWSISLAMTLDFMTMGVASFGRGMVMDRFGLRIVLLAGSSTLATGCGFFEVGEFRHKR
jgi:hypothetical protein